MNESSIKSLLYSWLSASLGERHVFTITFDSDLITGNVINGSFDAVAFTQVAFDTDHDTTMIALAEEIQRHAEVFTAEVTDDREITVTGYDPGNEITPVVTVTLGVSQAVAAFADVTEASLPTIIFADQNSPRPIEPYAVIRLSNVVKIGQDEFRDLQDDGIVTIGGQRRMTVSVSYFGTNPLQEISKAYNSLDKQSIQYLFQNAEVAIVEKMEIQNLTSMLETRFEPRAFFDFWISFADNIEDDLGIIEQVELTETIDGGSTGDIIIGPEIIDAT